ncbi:MAG: inositol 2-dehydrogenase [Spirochaetales bacterium]|jgi:myo-inositol 2-dehydrogenase / D-chiro-inositol 1-dehydrogenase|nr:inositol 2-dehydrogenase [Spirochaetales bacterium]
MQDLSTLVIGAGRIGILHAENIQSKVKNMSLAGIVEPAPSKDVLEWTKSRGIPLFNDLPSALKGVDAAAAVIALPTDLHEAIVGQAAAKGLHILCEKPVAPDLAAAERTVAHAKNAGVKLQIGFNRRFDHNSSALQRVIKSGDIGDLEILRITSRDPAPPDLSYIKRSGGLFMDMTIHDFDMCRFLGGDVDEVFAQGACLVDSAIGRAGDIDTAILTLKFVSGALGIIENSRRASYGYDQRAEAHCSKGSAATANDTGSSVMISDSEGVHGEKPLYFFLERYSDSFVEELSQFAEAVLGDSPLTVTGYDGVEAIRIAAAANLSMKERRPVKLSEIE